MRFVMAGFGVLLFALVTAVLMVWGMRKAYFQKETLAKMLMSKAAAKVMGYLKDHAAVTEAEIRTLVTGISAGEAYSRSRAVVQDDPAFTARLIEVMMHDGLIEPTDDKRSAYRKKK